MSGEFHSNLCRFFMVRKFVYHRCLVKVVISSYSIDTNCMLKTGKGLVMPFYANKNSIKQAKRHNNTLSGLKRKRSAETPPWFCSICDAKCYNETDLQNHLRGRRHQENVEALQEEGKGAEARLHEKEVSQLADKNLKPVSTWLCSICDANCTSQFDLENHLRGRRHQKNIEAFQGEGRGSEARLHENKMAELADNNQKPVSRWTCSICSANCKSQSDLSSHLRSRRHQDQLQ